MCRNSSHDIQNKSNVHGPCNVYNVHNVPNHIDHIYKEDFHKFVDALNSTVDHIKEELMPEVDFDEIEREDENRQERQ